jgi:hypothetical protein
LSETGVKQMRLSHGRDRNSPLCRRLSPEDPERGSRHEMALKVEVVVDGGMHAEQALGGSSRFEPLHLALPSSHHLMRVFGPIVPPEPLFMRTGQS